MILGILITPGLFRSIGIVSVIGLFIALATVLLKVRVERVELVNNLFLYFYIYNVTCGGVKIYMKYINLHQTEFQYNFKSVQLSYAMMKRKPNWYNIAYHILCNTLVVSAGRVS